MKLTALKQPSILLLFLIFTCTSHSADNYFCWDYEVSDTGTKGTRGLDFNHSTNTATSGSFDTVIYNVDGFPKCLGGNSNSRFKSLLKKLESENFNIVLMQEVFTAKKHSFIRDEDRITLDNYPFRSKHWRSGLITYGHGLLRLSDFPFQMNNINDNDYSLSSYEYELYDDCGGTDCLTEKGFSVAIHEITSEFKVHIYNTHMDAGSQNDDIKAKADQFDQLADFINAYSQGASIILGGDFNAKWADKSSADEYQTIWENFLAQTNLRLACQELINDADDSIANCDIQYKTDTDQILYRNSDPLYQLSLDNYEILDFQELSDHEPNRAQFSWQKR